MIGIYNSLRPDLLQVNIEYDREWELHRNLERISHRGTGLRKFVRTPPSPPSANPSRQERRALQRRAAKDGRS